MELTDDVSTNRTEIFDGRYYVYNKRTLCFIGHWPYQPFRQRCFRSSCITFLSLSLLIPQIFRCIILLRKRDDVGVFIECFGPTVTNFAYTVKFLNLVFNAKKIRNILDVISNDWAHMRHQKEEWKILQKYGEHGRFYTIFYMTLVNSVVAGWVMLPMLTVLMDYVIPLNETRPHLILFPADYGLEDPDKYFYWISLHGAVVCVMGMQMFIANDTLFMIMSKHACAMLMVLRFHLENIQPDGYTASSSLNSERQEKIYYRMIIECIRRHNRVVNFIKSIESSCEWSLVAIISLNVIVMSCTGSQIVAEGTPTQDVVRFTLFALAQLTHLFCNTLPGHWILSTSTPIRDSAYSCRWYSLSTRSRKLLILLMRRCLEPCTITAGKIYVMSMQNFCSVLQTTMSYFTMLTSTQ